MAEGASSSLQSLVQPLLEQEYSSYHQPADTEHLYESLLVNLEEDEDHPERAYVLEIFFLNDVSEALGAEETDEDAVILQFMLVLPFTIPVEAYFDVLRYCGLVNRQIPLGCFGLSEDDSAVYLRYCLARESRTIPETVLLEIVTAMEYASTEFGSRFEEIAAGLKKFEDFVRELEEATGQPLPSVGDPTALAAV